jgi:hypothetical protein
MVALKDLRKQSDENGLIILQIVAAAADDHGSGSILKLAQAIHQRWRGLIKSLVKLIENAAHQGRVKF